MPYDEGMRIIAARYAQQAAQLGAATPDELLAAPPPAAPSARDAGVARELPAGWLPRRPAPWVLFGDWGHGRADDDREVIYIPGEDIGCEVIRPPAIGPGRLAIEGRPAGER